ncbi:MAG: replicative DNA helicase, partial [Parvularculaceae bacterium]|nr:replicative DNA helicase [Parvularculaceae bacterium]
MADGAKIDDKSGTEAPYSIDAEQAVLGAILFDNEVYNRVASYLKPEHFYDPVHRVIYDASARLIQGGRVASPTIVDTFLASSEGFRETGGRDYLVKLARSVPSIVGAHDYGRVVFDMATRRGLIAIGTEMIERARDASLDDE